MKAGVIGQALDDILGIYKTYFLNEDPTKGDCAVKIKKMVEKAEKIMADPSFNNYFEKFVDLGCRGLYENAKKGIDVTGKINNLADECDNEADIEIATHFEQLVRNAAIGAKTFNELYNMSDKNVRWAYLMSC